MIGKIERVPLRQVWPHEAYDLTTWLQQNLDVLGDVINRAFSNVERERPAGNFQVDLVAEDESGNAVIIENQLEKSDHDHLGKLLTYMVAHDAKTAIWIVAEPRAEHVSAVAWLNESTPANFYLLKIEAIKIADSMPAPLLTLIVGPSEETREVRRAKQDFAEQHDLRRSFWDGLLAYSKSRSSLHSNISSSASDFIGTTVSRGLFLNYVVSRHALRIELYIDQGKNSEDESKHIFDQLFAHKFEIEQAFNSDLEWQRLDGRRASRICKILPGGLHNQDDWNNIHREGVETMIRLESALRPFLSQLKMSSDVSSR